MSLKRSIELSKHRIEQSKEDSDYDDEFVVKPEETKNKLKQQKNS